MSDEAAPREWRFFVEDMIGFCERVQAYTATTNRADFSSDPMRYDATIRNIELIGEAATHVPESVRTTHPEIPWRVIIATRNKLIHGYAGIDDDVLWSIVQSDIPVLLRGLRNLNA